MYVAESLCCTPETNTTLQINCTSIKMLLLKLFSRKKMFNNCVLERSIYFWMLKRNVVVVMYGCESWTIKKVEHQRIDD